MVLRREVIEERLKELDQILQELGKYRGTSSGRISASAGLWSED